MLRVIESFDYDDLSAMQAAGWSSTTINRLADGRIAGRALRMASKGNGFFITMFGLPERAGGGTVGFSFAFGSVTNVLNFLLLDGTQERCRVSLTGGGAIGIVSGGRQIAQTGGGSYVGKFWNHVNVMMRPDRTAAVAVNGNTVLIGQSVQAAFDRIGFSLPDNQQAWTDIDDFYFDDAVVSGDRAAMTLPATGLPYVPAAVFGVKTGSVVRGDNNGLPWTVRDLPGVEGDTVLISGPRPSAVSHSHSITVQ